MTELHPGVLENVDDNLKPTEDWFPEYQAENVLPPEVLGDKTFSSRGTRVSVAIVKNSKTLRKTKIIATLGPSSWASETMSQMLDAGMNIARFNFSHGSHESHLEVLQRYRVILQEKGSHAACLLDTRGPEIRTAMLKDHAPIKLEKGQEIIVEAVGDAYTTFEGYKNETETRIGLSYGRLCSSVKAGNRILVADGSVVIEVVEIMNERELKGRVMNSKELGERKNCNLPGVKVDIPVLTDKDIDDVQNFCAKHQMDYVAASFVQTGEDVRLIRRTLDEAGGHGVKIICKIENEEGLVNIDDIIRETDGIMVARGDLGMEIPSEKVALAQKMIITKCNIAGKFVITARQMLESMVTNPLPTRAEMTDVANAVIDGTDCVMLSGETANGAFPVTAVSTMASVVGNMELGVDYNSQYLFIRLWNFHQKGGIAVHEATLAAASQSAIDFSEDRAGEGIIAAEDVAIIVVITSTGLASDLVSKYRPTGPVLVVTDNEATLRQTSSRFGQYGVKVDYLGGTGGNRVSSDDLIAKGVEFAVQKGWMSEGKHVIAVSGVDKACADERGMVRFVAGLKSHRPSFIYSNPTKLRYLKSIVSTAIDTKLLVETAVKHRRMTKIVCTMGPKCWDTQTLGLLVDAGMNIARFNFSHGSHESHLEVLQRYREVLKSKGSHAACLLDTKGPEIRTAMLKDHAPIKLEKGQEIIVEAVGDAYTTFEGYKNETETRIGLSYGRLCSSVKAGNRILVADGSVVIEVVEIMNERELKGRVMNSKELGERKNCNLPGVKVDIPVLTDKDIDDVQNFCAKHQMDYVAASFVQTGEDVRLIRRTLDEAGGHGVKIICKIENEEGLVNIDDIIRETDGIMVARGDLGMEIPSEKVALAQKMMITKCNIAGKFVITATQMLESMVTNPLPTRAEMTDVANAVVDGTDCVMLSGETANGAFPNTAVNIMAHIVCNAEVGINKLEVFNFIRNWTPKPMSHRETITSSVVQSSLDMQAALIVIFTDDLRTARLVCKWRPSVPVVVVTQQEQVARQCSSHFGLAPMLVASVTAVHLMMPEVASYARAIGLAELGSGVSENGQVVVLSGKDMNMAGNLLQVTTYVFGGESVSLVKPSGYHGDHTMTFKSTKVGLDVVLADVFTVRKTKIVCTMGPKCWGEAMMGKLIDAGMNIARFNFSHGSHESHLEVLQRYREVLKSKGSHAACLLDTKGPEIRTAMLKDHAPIKLEKGQEIIVEAVGDAYTTFEGYKNETETRIGLSYGRLCSSVKAGNRILVADGSVVIEVVEIMNERELKGRVMNSKELGERKNCNLPGVKVDIPVLTDKDIDDVQNFCAKHQMDYVAASFVQTGEDVRLIRRTLDEAGGHGVKIICKIENEEGLVNIDDIIRETDGIMVARGDLGMEIPSEKVALAQKMIITKCNIAGKFVITATQMLESMVTNPLPTRAEMTDVANAVFDGTDCVMLSGETANGAFPDTAVEQMAHIVANAELGVNYFQVGTFIRDFTPKPVGMVEAVLTCAAKNAVDVHAGLVVVFSESGEAARLIAKYRPCVPVVVVTTSAVAHRCCSSTFSLYPYVVEVLPTDEEEQQLLLDKVLSWAVKTPLCPKGTTVIVVRGAAGRMSADTQPAVELAMSTPTGRARRPSVTSVQIRAGYEQRYDSTKTISIRCNSIALTDICSQQSPVRKTKIVCTMGPKCWDEETLALLIDAGMNIARFNFSHGSHESHLEVLQRYREVLKSKGSHAACLLDTKGPEIRTAMLKDHAPIKLEKGQEIIVEAVGDAYTTFEGYKNETETRIGLSYGRLCSSVKAGNRILVADGSVVIEVVDIMNERELKGRVMNSKELGERKNCNLPGVKVDIPVLTDKDIDDVQNFCAKHQMDYVAASFVQTGEDVRLIRRTLDEAGGHGVKIICKIENEEGLVNIDDIIRETDGIMVARGDLGMEIPSEKVALAQKMMITKCNIAGKFVITATQMLESMVTNPLPTRAEMTDVANAVFDGTDCVMLSGETANGAFPAVTVETMAAIVRNAELVNNYYAVSSFIRDFTPKPFTTRESVASSAVKIALDSNAVLCVVVSSDGETANLVSKYKPIVPVLVVTPSDEVARATSAQFAQYATVMDGFEELLFGQRPQTFVLTRSHSMKIESQLGTQLDQSMELVILRARALGLIPRQGGKVVILADSDQGRLSVTFCDITPVQASPKSGLAGFSSPLGRRQNVNYRKMPSAEWMSEEEQDHSDDDDDELDEMEDDADLVAGMEEAAAAAVAMAAMEV